MAARFRTTILQAGKTATGIEIPPEVVEALGTSRRPAVSVTIKGYTYRSTVAVMGGTFMVGVSAKVREAAGVEGGTPSRWSWSSIPRRVRWRFRPT